MSARRTTCVAAAVLALSLPAGVYAQGPWTPDKGQLYLTPTYQYLNGGDHLFSVPFVFGFDYGEAVDLGTVQSQVFVIDGDFGITDKLAISGAVAFVGSKFVNGGLGDETNNYGELDDGSWHGSFQDGRIAARYMLYVNDTVTITPAVYWGFPTNAYTTLGHTAFGTGIKELRIGAEWGLLFDSMPRMYFLGAVSYAFMDNPRAFEIEVPLDRTNITAGLGYTVKAAILQAWGDYQITHGGIDWWNDVVPDAPVGILVNHDLAADADFFRLGGGVSIPINLSWTAFGNVATTVWGQNTHRGTTVTVGATWRVRLFGGTDWW